MPDIHLLDVIKTQNILSPLMVWIKLKI